MSGNDDFSTEVQTSMKTGSKQTETNTLHEIDPLLSKEAETVMKASTDIHDLIDSDQVNAFVIIFTD